MDGVCCRCQHWKAINFDGWQWVDNTALCGLTGEPQPRGHRCYDGYLQHTTKTMAYKIEDTAVIRKQAPDLATAMEEWYEKNKHQFDIEVQHSTDRDGSSDTPINPYSDVVDWRSLSEEDQAIWKICVEPGNNIDRDPLFKHQIEDIWRYKDETEDALFLEQGCVAEGTIVQYGYKGATNKMPIERAFKKQGGTKQKYIRGLLESDTFGLIAVNQIVESGVKDCIQLTTSSGRTLVLTPDHPVLTTEGWVEAGRLTFDHLIVCNGMSEHSRRNYTRKDRVHQSSEYVGQDGYVYLRGPDYVGYPNKRSDGRLLKHRYVMEQHLGRYLTSNELVHHLDGNKLNNNINNLEVVTKNQHNQYHAKTLAHNLHGKKDYVHTSGAEVVTVPKFEHLVSSVPVGKRRTYDVQCAYPNNFTANRIVVHNCGKSAIVLRIVSWLYLHKKIDCLLVVAPNDVHKQWAVEQIPVWLPPSIPRELQCFGGRGGLKSTYPFRYPDYLHIVCVNVDTFSQPNKWEEIAEWVKATRCFVVLDEATAIKNVTAKRTQRLLYEFNDVVKRGKAILSSHVRTVGRAILTGTPATNGVVDFWSLMEFLRPNYFGRNWYSFRQRYAMLATITAPHGPVQIMLTPELWEGVKNCSGYDQAFMLFGVSVDTYDTIQKQSEYQGAYKHEEELKELIKPVSVFRLLQDCTSMPPQVYNKKSVVMSDHQKRAYGDMEKELLAMFGGVTTTAANKLSALVRLQQISSGFIVQGAFNFDGENFKLIGDDEYDLEPGQVQWLGNSIPKLERLYEDVEESARPCIVITRFSAEAARIYDDLSKQYRCLLYTGWKKTGDVEDFKEGKYDILVANIRCISRGFNLQRAHQMFFYSNTFSLEDRLQTEGRIFRLGQKSTCLYTDYLNEGTIDVKVIGALRQKRALLDYIRGTSLIAFVKEEDEITELEQTQGMSALQLLKNEVEFVERKV